MEKNGIKPANGRLGILIVGNGAVATTFMTGVLLTRKGLAKPIGSMKQDDDTTRLLDAMRPFLSEERQIKLDKAKRLIRVMKLMPLLKDLPLFDL